MRRTSNAKARLLETAMDLMYARGYTAVGVQELCERAKVNKGSFYHFFPSKRALVLAVIEAYAEHVRDVWEDAMTATCPPLVRMQRVFEIVYDAHRTLAETGRQMHGCPIGNLALELSGQDAVVRQKLQATFMEWAGVVERVLQEAVATGVLPAIDTVTTAQTVVAYFEGVMMLAKTQNDPGVITRLAQGAVHLVEAAARAQTYDGQ